MAIYNTNISGGLNTKDANATSADILTGKTAYVGKEKVEGEMPNNGDVSTAIENGVLKAGYTSGGQIANLIAANIKKDVSIGGVNGSLQGSFETTVTVSTTSGTVQVTHNLGYVPRMAAIIRTEFGVSNKVDYAFCIDTSANTWVQRTGGVYSPNTGSTFDYYFALTSTTATFGILASFNSSQKYGGTYTVFLM